MKKNRKEKKIWNPVSAFFLAIWTAVSIYIFLFNPPSIIRVFLLDLFEKYSLAINIYQGLQFIFGVPFAILVIFLVIRFVVSLFDNIYFKI